MIKNITTTCVFLLFSIYTFAQTKSVSISPNIGGKGQTLNVTITGVNTNFDVGTNTISFIKSGTTTLFLQATNITNVGPTKLNATLFISASATLGSYNLVVNNKTDGDVKQQGAFSVITITPTISSISPSTGIRGQTLNVSITGLNTNFNKGTNTVSFTKSSASTLHVQAVKITNASPTQINATLFISASATLGNYGLSISNAIDGTINLLNCFNVTATSSVLKSITPSSASQGALLKVTIIGANSRFKSATQTTFGFNKNGFISSDINIQNTNAIDDTTFTANIFVKPNAATGPYTPFLIIDMDTMILTNAFRVQKSTVSIDSIRPKVAQQNKTLDVSVVGTRSHFTQGSPVFTFYLQGTSSANIDINSLAIINDTNAVLNITIKPIADTGYVNLLYSNIGIDGSTSLLNGFYIMPSNGVNVNELLYKNNDIKIYPNPAKDNINIEAKNNILSIQILDLTNRLIHQALPPTKQNYFNILLQNLLMPKEIYLIKIETEEGTITKRIVLE